MFGENRERNSLKYHFKSPQLAIITILCVVTYFIVAFAFTARILWH
jgi:hypothetical protein